MTINNNQNKAELSQTSSKDKATGVSFVFSRSSVIIAGLCVLTALQLLAGFLFVKHYYLQGKTNEAFDNYVLDNGAWKLFGAKEYGSQSYNEFYHFNPGLSFVDESTLVLGAEGFLHKVTEYDDRYEVEVRKTDQDPQIVTLSKDDYLTICITAECSNKMSPIEIGLGTRVFVYRSLTEDGQAISHILTSTPPTDGSQ